MAPERHDDAFYVVISLDRPYDVHVETRGTASDITVSNADTIEIPFATLASAERVMGGIMPHVRAGRTVLRGDVVSEPGAIEG